MSKNSRYLSIDAYRAFIMLLMIFVNDTWTLIDIPKWIEHLPAEADGLGLADVVFPAFLFIVGLSIPMAIRSRLKKGESKIVIAGHIALRAAALIIMGIFHVNLESYPSDAIIHKSLWQFLITIAFFLVWLDYEDHKSLKSRVFKIIGIILLIILAFLYSRNNSGVVMAIHWWGILGLIGWSYLIVSLFYLLTNGGWKGMLLILILLVSINMLAQSDVSSIFEGIKQYVWIVGDGSLPALTTAGVLVSLLYLKMEDKKIVLIGYLIFIAILFISMGLLARMEWNISKIWSTPSFTLICTGISVAGFAMMIYIVESKKWVKWYNWISPAGTSTLTCYLLPYLHYALLGVVMWQLPEVLRTGLVGVIKSILYAIIIILITGWLEKRRLRLKL